jgi:hypothetical protein
MKQTRRVGSFGPLAEVDHPVVGRRVERRIVIPVARLDVIHPCIAKRSLPFDEAPIHLSNPTTPSHNTDHDISSADQGHA